MNSDERPVITFDYRQSLSASGGGKSWNETLDISLRLSSEAFSSGWYRQLFGKDAKSFILLMALVMHARPLRGADLRLLVRLGMAQDSDEGRLYARVTDSGLADELGMHRDTVAACAARLSKLGLIETVRIPEDVEFRDSYGQYAGSKVYLVAGNLEGQMNKSIRRRAQYPGAAGGDARPAENSGMVGSETGAAEKSSTDGAEKFGMDASEIESAEKSRAHAEKTGTVQADLGLKSLETSLQGAEKFRSAAENSGINKMKKKKRRRKQSTPGQPLLIAPELQGAVQVLSAAGLDLDSGVLGRLEMMANDADPLARSAQSSGAEWVRAALQLGLGVASPGRLLNYASAVLNDWLLNGRPLKRRQRAEGAQKASSTPHTTTTQQAIESYLLRKKSQKEHGDGQ